MLDTKAFYQIAKSLTITAAKAMHKPSLQSKEAMTAYAKDVGAYGVKASFTMEQKASGMLIEWN
jgi:hypothetical protein